MGLPFPEPTGPVPTREQLYLRYLDYFRSTVLAKVDGLTDGQLRGSALPSGWSPLELVQHLAWVERRWLVWGFGGHDLPDPWGDEHEGRWHVPDETSAAEELDVLRAQGATTRRIVEGHPLDERGQPSGRWDGAEPATLERVLLHLLQEYARHAGHLDVARELLDGVTGE